MAKIKPVTFGRHQLTEGFIFAGFLLLAVYSFITISQQNSERLWSIVAQSPTCNWDTSAPITTPTNPGKNLYTNASFATTALSEDMPVNWQVNSWGEIEPTFTYLHDLGRTDSTSVKVEVKNAFSGDAKWEHNVPIGAIPEQSYVYRNHYQSNTATYTIVEVILVDNSRQYINFGMAKPSSEWKELTYTFVTPKQTALVNVFQVLSQQGYLITDDYFLGRYDSPPLENGLVSLTFDDGAKTIHANALPLLKQYQLKSSQYVVTEPLSKPYNRYHIDSTQLRDFINDGHEVGSHTVDHASLPGLEPKRLRYELANSQLDLYQLMGERVTGFSVPFGQYDESVLKMVRQYYCYHRSTDTGYNTPDNFDLYNIRVQNVELTTPVEEIVDWIDYADRKKVWLVLVFHEIDHNGGKYSYTPENLAKVLEHLTKTPVKVVTLQEAIPIMQTAQKAAIPGFTTNVSADSN